MAVDLLASCDIENGVLLSFRSKKAYGVGDYLFIDGKTYRIKRFVMGTKPENIDEYDVLAEIIYNPLNN